MERVYRADTYGDDAYYTRDDLEWVVEPTGDDPGVTRPKPGAVPRDRHGDPLVADEPDLFDDFTAP